MSDRKPPRVTVDEALEVARNATGATLLVLVGPKQAERLYLALQIAEKLVNDMTASVYEELVRYAELKAEQGAPR